MLRDRSPVEALVTYATFLAVSLVIHIVLILSGRPRDALDVAPLEASRVEGLGAAEVPR